MARLIEHQRISFTEGQYSIEVIDTCYAGRSDEHAQDDFHTWKKFPRGLCHVVIRNPLGICVANNVLFGLNKFTYIDQPKFMREMDFSKLYKKYYMTKENGECMHISAFRYDTLNYWIIGSKNVHIILKKSDPLEDLNRYVTQQFTFASAMAQQFFNNSNIKFDSLFTYLADNHYTFCIESCRTDSLHITLYTESKVFLYAITSPSSQGITAMKPSDVHQIAQQFGFDPINYKESLVTDCQKLTDIEKEITASHNCEGSVVYVSSLDNSGQEVIIWAYKYKSDEYVIWRAIREIMKMKLNMTVSINKISRLKSTHKDVENVEKFVQQGLRLFIYWYKEMNADQNYCATRYPYLLEQFRTLDENKLVTLDQQLKIAPPKTKNNIGIIFKGVPCSGKTTIGYKLVEQLGGIYIDQDMFDCDRNQFIRKLNKLVQEETPVIVVGKSHFTKRQRTDTMSCFSDDYKIYIIDLQFNGNANQYEEFIKSRLIQRGHNHPTLRPDRSDIDDLIKGFIKSMTPLDANEINKCHCITIDMTLPTETITSQIMEQISHT